MLAFVGRRLLSGVVLVVVVASLTFFLLAVGGASIARTLLGETASPEQVAAKAAELGLDRGVLVRFAEWLGGAVRGDLGTSWLTNEPVTTGLLDRLPVTLSVALASILVTALVSVLLGVLAAVRRGWVDRLVQVLAVVGFAMPGLWLALLLVLGAAITLGWFPATGYVPLDESPVDWVDSLILPVTAITVGSVAATAQQVRSAMIGTLEQDYIRTLRSRGVPEHRVILLHALRNAAPNGLTVLSVQFINLLASTVFIERIFALPGIGSMVLDATTTGDHPQVLGVVVLMVVLVVVVNLAIDLVNGWLNPKVRVR